MADTQCCSSTHSLSAQPSRGYTLDSPTHMHTPSSSALPLPLTHRPPSQAFPPARSFASNHSEQDGIHAGQSSSAVTRPCATVQGDSSDMVTRMAISTATAMDRANDEHHHSHGHSHAHHHHTSDHPHDCDHDHDHEHDDVEVFTDSKHGDYLHLPGRYRVTLTVLGMDCPSCSPRVVRALNDLPSVGECHVDVFAGRATVTYHPDHVDTTEMMQHVTASTGFKCQIVQDGPVGESSGPTRRMRIQLDSPMEEKDPEMRGVKVVQEEQADLIEVEYEAGLNPREVLVHSSPGLESRGAPPFTSHNRLGRALFSRLGVCMGPASPTSDSVWRDFPRFDNGDPAIRRPPIYVSGIRALTVQRTIDMDLLVALSTGPRIFFPLLPMGSARPDDRSTTKEKATLRHPHSSSRLSCLVDSLQPSPPPIDKRSRSVNIHASRPSHARSANRRSQVIPTGLVHINDILRLEPGDRIPTDGRVVSGEGHVDESSITGEILMGSNRSGLEMRVTLSPDENTLSRMAELMRAAQGARLRVQDTADRVAGWLAPVFWCLGDHVYRLGECGSFRRESGGGCDGASGGDERGGGGLDRVAVAVLVVSCPCAIALCVPMVAVIAVAVGTRRGVLFKTVEALESAYDVSVVVFDKTGTLTLGKLDSERGSGFDGFVTHPVSAAVHEHVVATLASASPLQTDGLDVKSVPGKGVEATVDGVVIRGECCVGGWGGVEGPWGPYGVCGSFCFTCIAYYILSDSLRPDALSTIKSLTQRGLEVHILSGDNHGVVTRTASALGIPTAQARGGCSPEEKGQWIKFLQGADGDEDCERDATRSVEAPKSDVCGRRHQRCVGARSVGRGRIVGRRYGRGIERGTGGVAVIVERGLTDVFKLARAARRRVWMNFAWAGMYNAVAILLACGVLGRRGYRHSGRVLRPLLGTRRNASPDHHHDPKARPATLYKDYHHLTALLAGATLTGIYLWYQSKSSRIPLPPGPRGNLIFGSALELRTSKAFWINFAKWTEPVWSNRLSDVFQRMIIVDDPKIITYLFEKKASQYSDRYVSQLALLIGWEKDIIFIEYGPLLKHYRTLLQRALNNRVVLDYLPLQEHEAKRLLRRLCDTPERFMQHIHLMAGSVAIRMVYGYRVDSPDDRLVQAAEQVMAIFSDISYGTWQMDGRDLSIITIYTEMVSRRYVPQGDCFLVPILQATEDETFEKTGRSNQAGREYTSKYVLRPVDLGAYAKSFKSLAASLYGAASDTTVSAVKSFFLAMTLYPDVQAKAQSEIATYLQAHSDKRFITMDDKPHLPYVSALVRETLRWHPVLTLVGHRSNGEDDENVVVGDKTYRIPARTAVIANVWYVLVLQPTYGLYLSKSRKIMHNPEVYSNPEKFIPERFLGDSPPPFPESYAFGFGRR
ncbi:Heavy metal translocatin [Rhizoctonia solani]|uniref:Heavy metal translocatin n=1 Tax=Rhizoctonia solani TaxID=456999 RepID=A0A8H7IKB6_9AGAM|nr:Heavy metal translocatin [Rhizoctonia solani]